MAPGAVIEFDHAITLFEKAAVHPFVQKVLPILVRLRNKARDQARQELPGPLELSFSKERDTTFARESAIRNCSNASGGHDRDNENELSFLRGKTSLLSVLSTKRPNDSRLQMSTSIPPHGERSAHANKDWSVDPFGLLQYGGLSASQFVAEQALDTFASDNVLEPIAAWQSFVQNMDISDLYTL